MTSELRSHSTTLEISAPAQVAVGDEIALQIKASCPHGCDLRGRPVRLEAPGGAEALGELAACNDGSNETAIRLNGPRDVGEHVFKAVVPQHESDGIRHEECSNSVVIKTGPLATSLAVWDIPSPVVTGERFAIKVGAKSASGCALTGKAIEVCDETGVVLARGEFGDAPWPGTSALYWTNIALPAPASDGIVSWSARFAATQLELPHESSSSKFSVSIVRPSEHRLTVKVVEKESNAAIADVEVLIGAYRATTNGAGLADLHLPKGTYELAIWKVGYEAVPKTLAVDSDASVEIAAAVLPADDPDALWQM